MKLDASILQSLLEFSGVSCRYVQAESIEDNDTVEVGDDVYIEVKDDQLDVWRLKCNKYNLTHQLERYQEVIELLA